MGSSSTSADTPAWVPLSKILLIPPQQRHGVHVDRAVSEPPNESGRRSRSRHGGVAEFPGLVLRVTELVRDAEALIGELDHEASQLDRVVE